MLELESIISRGAADVFLRKRGTGESRLESHEGSVEAKSLDTDSFGDATLIVLSPPTTSSGPKHSVILVVSPKRCSKPSSGS